jgi:hypothetical protein
MKLYSATIDTFRRFKARRQSPRTVERRTYVFILVPFGFNRNGSAKKAEVAQNFIDNGSDPDGAPNDALSTLTALDRNKLRRPGKTTSVREVNDESELNYDLMWTWFLPNPLWPPKGRK